MIIELFWVLWYSLVMRLEHESEKELKAKVLGIIGKHLDLEKYQVFAFGSRVNGKGDECSDIDIGVEGAKKIPLRTLYQIREEIEALPYLYKIDIIDFKDVSDKFYQIAKEKIELINQHE